MPTTPTKPRDITPGDTVRLERLTSNYLVESIDRTVLEISTIPGGRYRIQFDGEDSPRYYHAKATLPVVPQ